MFKVTQLVQLGLEARSLDTEIGSHSPRMAAGRTRADNLSMRESHPWGHWTNSCSDVQITLLD